jgi:hypothetical protein
MGIGHWALGIAKKELFASSPPLPLSPTPSTSIELILKIEADCLFS